MIERKGPNGDGVRQTSDFCQINRRQFHPTPIKNILDQAFDEKITRQKALDPEVEADAPQKFV